MSDLSSFLPDFPGPDADEELVFDDAIPAATAAPPAPANDQPARAPRRGRKSARAEAVVVAPSGTAGTDAPVEQKSAEAPLHASADEPAGGAHAPFPPHGAMPAGSTPNLWLLGIVALATVSSFASLGGLLTVSRTLAHAQADQAAAASERAGLARIPALVARLDAASARLESATARASAASPAGPPATVADLRHELDMLKLALAQRQPDGLAALNGEIRGTLQDLATRVDRLSAQLGPRGAAPAMPAVPARRAETRAASSASAGAARGSRGAPAGRAVHPRNGTAFKDD